MAKLLEGRVIADRIKEELKVSVRSLKQVPVLASIVIGENASAVSYAKSQQKLAVELGIEYCLRVLSQGAAESQIVELIQELNNDQKVNGIIIQMPLPKQIDYKSISRFISRDKDIEGLNSPVVAAVMELIKTSGVDLYGQEVVVVGYGEILGKPLALLLLDKFATLTVCHIGTSQAGKLEEHVRRAEVLIAAVGQAGLIKGEWIKPGALVIDAGINRVGDKIVGDVEFAEAAKRASFITPVPGGVGPLTVAILMRNLVQAVQAQQ
ncbi:MAG: bifunctional 5,10-methylenetetrahydrofolate dehydrogenase/5,10-methenyltetrahydrofolate cyclohydrolase [Candidatus Omnitrophica bacterium]|nr:bifunctional 5,10-methylenetetrahydrofolate dehydrogenase/5,10-methenyltetrahydrofolate cyclohydrolase [Candidatus Omnitrophota bacterium]